MAKGCARWPGNQRFWALGRVLALEKKLSAVSPRPRPKGCPWKIQCADNRFAPTWAGCFNLAITYRE